MTLWYQFIGGSVPVTARENFPMVHMCGCWMSYRYFTIKLLLLCSYFVNFRTCECSKMSLCYDMKKKVIGL